MNQALILMAGKPQDCGDIGFIDKWVDAYIYMLSRSKENLATLSIPWGRESRQNGHRIAPDQPETEVSR